MFGKRNIKRLSDEDLLSRFCDTGKSEYFGELYNRYIPLLYGVCLKYLGDEDSAKDAVMQLFENLLSKIRNYQIDVFRTWIYTVVKNHCLQILRKNKQELIVDFNSQIMESDEILHLFEEEDKNERFESLKKCMEKLPEQQRAVIVYFFMDEMSYADIVEQTDYNLNQVKSYIQNGKRNLKICMEKNAS